MIPDPMRLIGLALLFPITLLLAACGGGGSAETVRVEGTEYAYVTPSDIKGGVVAMEFANVGKEPHEFAMGRLAPGKTLADFRREIDEGGDEGPESSVDVGGVPLLSPGEQVTITRSLQPGTYALVCFVPASDGKTHYDHGMIGSFEVEGDSGNELPEADATIVAREDSYDVPELEAGTQVVELRNAASEPREFNLVRLEPGKTIADAEQWFANGSKGPAPLAFLGAMQSIPPGTSVFLTLDFEQGQRYVVVEEEHDFRAEFTVK
jgi:uncharacterized cupredoxin-like copper-binding protein